MAGLLTLAIKPGLPSLVLIHRRFGRWRVAARPGGWQGGARGQRSRRGMRIRDFELICWRQLNSHGMSTPKQTKDLRNWRERVTLFHSDLWVYIYLQVNGYTSKI
ncbi:hypothetical protein B0H14DRAFT_2565784 [Mycena olivaceomarginata]|nr:hypothetical protein B0H14DRAFT_2565784 [Mycena olivaceomarginata]